MISLEQLYAEGLEKFYLAKDNTTTVSNNTYNLLSYKQRGVLEKLILRVSSENTKLIIEVDGVKIIDVTPSSLNTDGLTSEMNSYVICSNYDSDNSRFTLVLNEEVPFKRLGIFLFV